jgi:hypothetical protein
VVLSFRFRRQLFFSKTATRPKLQMATHQIFSRAPLWPLLQSRTSQAARPAAMRRFGQSAAPQRAPQTIASTVPRPAPLGLPSTIALDSFFVQHAPLNDASLASTPRPPPEKALMKNPGTAPQKLSGNKGGLIRRFDPSFLF